MAVQVLRILGKMREKRGLKKKPEKNSVKNTSIKYLLILIIIKGKNE